MKKVCILFIFCIFALCSCTNQFDAYKTIETEFPNAEILNCSDYRFVIIDSTSIYYVECLNLYDGKITHKQLLKKWQSQ